MVKCGDHGEKLRRLTSVNTSVDLGPWCLTEVPSKVQDLQRGTTPERGFVAESRKTLIPQFGVNLERDNYELLLIEKEQRLEK